MKKQIILTGLMLSTVSLANAGSSFWGGFGLGTFSGMVTNEIIHHAHRPRREVVVHHHQPVEYVQVERPTRYVEVKTIKPEPVSYELAQENSNLRSENQYLKNQITTLQDDLELADSKNAKLKREMSSLTKKIDQLENSIEQVNKKLKKASIN